MPHPLTTTALALGAFAATAFVVGHLSSVTVHDVPPQYGLVNRPQLGVVAGELYAVSADGLSHDRICPLVLRADARNEEAVDTTYSNLIADYMPFVDVITSWGADAESVPATPDLRFVGTYVALDAEPVAGTGEACEALMVARFLRRERLCLVERSLTSENVPIFSAYEYEERQIWVPEEAFEAHGRARPDWADTHSALRCPNGPRLPWPVRVRKMLGLVVPVVAVNDAPSADSPQDVALSRTWP